MQRMQGGMRAWVRARNTRKRVVQREIAILRFSVLQRRVSCDVGSCACEYVPSCTSGICAPHVGGCVSAVCSLYAAYMGAVGCVRGDAHLTRREEEMRLRDFLSAVCGACVCVRYVGAGTATVSGALSLSLLSLLPCTRAEGLREGPDGGVAPPRGYQNPLRARARERAILVV